MLQEKLAILEKLEKKEINAEEAERLLAALREKEEPTAKPEVTKVKGKSLKVYVKSDDGDVVNIQIPLNLAKMLVRSKGTSKQVNLGGCEVNVEDLIDLIESGTIGEFVNIESSDGDIVKVFVE